MEKYGFSEEEADDQKCSAHWIHLLLTTDVLKKKKHETFDPQIVSLVAAVGKKKRILRHALIFKKTKIAKIHELDESEASRVASYL